MEPEIVPVYGMESGNIFGFEWKPIFFRLTNWSLEIFPVSNYQNIDLSWNSALQNEFPDFFPVIMETIIRCKQIH